MIGIYNPRNWQSGVMLAQHMIEQGCDVAYNVRSRVLSAEHIINWGFTSGVQALNNRILGNKLKELEKLKDADVKCIEFATEPRYGAQWFARTLNHRGGRDFVRRVPIRRRAYWVKFEEDIQHEMRVHIINDKCVKVGLKVRKDETAHPWVRSLRYGWRPSYSAEVREYITPGIRDIAKRAVRALDYDFAAVDVGVKSNGEPVVFEVNTAPGLKPGIAAVYARHFKEMLNVE